MDGDQKLMAGLVAAGATVYALYRLGTDPTEPPQITERTVRAD